MIRAVLSTYRDAFSGMPRSVWLLGVAAFVNRCGTMIFPFLALYLSQERDFSTARIGELISLYGVGAIGGAYLGGWLCRFRRPVWVQVASLCGTGLVCMVFLHLSSWIEYAVTLAVFGFVSESLRPANLTMVAEMVSRDLRPRAMAVNRLAVNLGWAVGPAAGGFLATVDYDLLFYAEALTSLLAAVLLVAFFGRSRSPEDDEKEAAEGVVQRGPWRDGVFLCAMALVFVMALVFFQVFTTYPLYLRQAYGLSEADFGLIFTVNTALIVAFEMVLIKRIERSNPLVIMGLGSLLICLGVGAIAFGQSYAFCLLTVAIWTFGEMLSMPVASAFVTSRSGVTSRGTFMGLYAMAFSLANAAAPAMGARLYEVAPELLWFVCLVVGAVTSGGFLLLARVEKRSRQPTEP